MLSTKEKEILKSDILQKIEETKKSIEKLEELTQPIAPNVSLGRLTRMEAINEKSINESSLRTAKDTLIKLEQALTRMEQPDYGNCFKCGKPIPFARLQRMPESNRCVNCVGK